MGEVLGPNLVLTSPWLLLTCVSDDLINGNHTTHAHHTIVMER